MNVMWSNVTTTIEIIYASPPKMATKKQCKLSSHFIACFFDNCPSYRSNAIISKWLYANFIRMQKIKSLNWNRIEIKRSMAWAEQVKKKVSNFLVQRLIWNVKISGEIILQTLSLKSWAMIESKEMISAKQRISMFFIRRNEKVHTLFCIFSILTQLNKKQNYKDSVKWNKFVCNSWNGIAWGTLMSLERFNRNGHSSNYCTLI